jgi:alkylated DNA repair protein alkB homolog 1
MPPQAICNMYKKYQKMDDASVDGDLNVVDFRRGLDPEQREKIVPVDVVSSEVIAAAQKAFKSCCQLGNGEAVDLSFAPEACTIYEHKDFDGQWKPLIAIQII